MFTALFLIKFFCGLEVARKPYLMLTLRLHSDKLQPTCIEGVKRFNLWDTLLDYSNYPLRQISSCRIHCQDYLAHQDNFNTTYQGVTFQS